MPHADGRPKYSVYLGIYRVLEHVPLDALQSLWLVTRHGRVLEVHQGELTSEYTSKYHLYQEMGPVHPQIARALAPGQFGLVITYTPPPVPVSRMCHGVTKSGSPTPREITPSMEDKKKDGYF